jgi:cytochrome oxidase Cu insertion factor (SCO1/SenC/PrrC family)
VFHGGSLNARVSPGSLRGLFQRPWVLLDRRNHAGVPLLILAVVTFLALTGCQKKEAAPVGGTPIQLLDLDGRLFDLWKNPGALTVVLFTRSDCPISNRCAPEIRRLHEKYQSRGVAFYLIYVDPQEQADTLRKHIKEYAYPCQGLRDPKHTLVEHCGATTTPEAVVFGSDRAIVYRGRIDDRYSDFGEARAQPTTYDLAEAIEATLQGQPVTNPRTKAIGCLIADLKE